MRCRAARFLSQLGFNVNHSKLLGLIQHAFTLDTRTLTWLALAAAGYAVIEIIEAVGLWLLKRWGEYFAMIATSVGIPYEIYDLTAKVTVLRLMAFVINVALVVYLVVTKRLFGVRGGRKAYEARLRGASILQAEIDAWRPRQPRPGHAGARRVSPAGRTSQTRPPGRAGRHDRPPTAATAGPPGGRRGGRAGPPDRPAGAAAARRGGSATPVPKTARGPDQPTDAAATSSSAAE